MLAHWNIDDATLQRWRELVDSLADDKFVQARRQRNVERIGIDLSISQLWHVMVGCQVTSMQRSGPTSNVSKFMESGSPALDYDACCEQTDVESFLVSELQRGSLWRAKPIARNLSKIQAALQTGEWSQLTAQLDTLKHNTTKAKERKVARYMQSGKFPGLGPKQSRNYLQWLGLSRYEVPLDSRMLKTLKCLGSNFVPKGTALGDEVVYLFIQDAVQEIAKRLDVYPCILDACVFASRDRSDA